MSVTSIIQTQFKRGDTREDNYVFIKYYHKGNKRYEQWLSPKNNLREKLRCVLKNCRNRAIEFELPFDLTLDYLVEIFPEDMLCPVFKTAMVFGNADGRNQSPSLDRIIPELGYTQGNVLWVSFKANRAKNNLDLGELKALLAFYEPLLSSVLH